MPAVAVVVSLAAVVAADRALVEAVDGVSDVLEARPGLLATQPQAPVLIQRLIPPSANLPGKIGAHSRANDDVVALEQARRLAAMMTMAIDIQAVGRAMVVVHVLDH